MTNSAEAASATASDTEAATTQAPPLATTHDEDLAPEPSSAEAATPSDVAAPGFADPDVILEEEAFDGADLAVNSIDIHEDSDIARIVIALDGQGFPGWHAEYADQIGSQSSLELTVRGVGPHEIPPLPESDLLTIDVAEPTNSDLTLRLELAQEPAPYRVHLQYSPLRLVVEFSI